MKKIKVIGICGSARKGSYNMSLLNYISNNKKEEIDFEILEINKLPMFNEDLEENTPIEVINYIDKLMIADGFIIATPEHNYSVPALLKNALDWGSRGERKGFDNKPVAIISASLGMLGGARVQYQLRQICISLNLIPLNRPEVFIGSVYDKIDDNGNIKDDYTKDKIMESFNNLVDKIKTDL